MNSALIFGGLIALMLTGMPISIALGLTVLGYLFFLTTVPIEARREPRTVGAHTAMAAAHASAVAIPRPPWRYSYRRGRTRWSTA